jgi:C4-dicarboxylate transporter DctQ subunit
MNFIHRINSWIEKGETVLIVFIVLFMVLLAFLQVVLRNVFSQGILWGDILLRQMVLWIGFIGASLATREEKHINIDLFGRMLPGKGKRVVKIITHFFSAVVCLFLVKAAWVFVIEEREMATTLFNDIPSWYFQLIIPVGFLLMAFRFLIHMVEGVAIRNTDNADDVDKKEITNHEEHEENTKKD